MCLGPKSLASPFHVYQVLDNETNIRSYTVAAGDTLTDTFAGDSHLKVYGPNGFYREFKGGKLQPSVGVSTRYQRGLTNQFTGDVLVKLANTDPGQTYQVEILDNGYNAKPQIHTLAKAGTKGAELTVELDLKNSFNWYDFSVKVVGFDEFEHRLRAGLKRVRMVSLIQLIGQESKNRQLVEPH